MHLKQASVNVNVTSLTDDFNGTIYISRLERSNLRVSVKDADAWCVIHNGVFTLVDTDVDTNTDEKWVVENCWEVFILTPTPTQMQLGFKPLCRCQCQCW